jgi:hypothetical protein
MKGFFKPSHYAERLFPHKDHVKESTEKIEDTLKAGVNAFYEHLDELKISDLLEEGAWEEGLISWGERLS